MMGQVTHATTSKCTTHNACNMGTVKYLIKVDIHEVKDIIFKEPGTEVDIVPNLYILVTVGSNNYSTVQRNQASNAVFNASFNFTVDLTPSEFQRTRVIISLHHKYTLQSALIGHHAFGLPLIYSKQQHCIHRSWARVICPSFPSHNAVRFIHFHPGNVRIAIANLLNATI
ncbi:C2 domain superfamily [Babesia duncani]|uniref:C2 domain superfamily n=1 Tax=Babesia duncani TaxID=323732 RepID=A0AAD9PIR3_9APIC|nr:C2 domain superfamily [Babesia duncani]